MAVEKLREMSEAAITDVMMAREDDSDNQVHLSAPGKVTRKSPG